MITPKSNYEEYPSVDWLLQENNKHKSRVNMTLKDVKNNETILDVGAGVGTLSIPMKDKGCEVTCIEIKKEYIDYLREKGFKVIEGDAREVMKGIANNAYDVVVLGEIIEHMQNFGTLLKEASRIARRKVIYSIPACDDAWHYWMCRWYTNGVWNVITMIKKVGYKDEWK